jgi:hypothetical protein
MNLSDKILDYHFNLHGDLKLPHGVHWLDPYQETETQHSMRAFYSMYYNDNAQRSLILGINPGRFGAGITGVPFTDPIRLADECGIQNSFPRRKELSSVFVYDVIHAFGGCKAFYKKMYISALCPLGFVKDNKNYNYYDDPFLMKIVEPFIIAHLKAQIELGVNTKRVYCLGQGKNYQYLEKLNNGHQLFKEIVPLPHPRWVMQYRLKEKAEYVQMYLVAFGNL